MQMQYEKPPLRIRLKILFMFLKFMLVIMAAMMAATVRKKKKEPSLQDVMYGEKIPFSDNEYFIPAKKLRK
jgi:hypothetical protein